MGRWVWFVSVMLSFHAAVYGQPIPWTQTEGLVGESVHAIAYASSGSFFLVDGSSNSEANLHRSLDRGRSWSPVSIGGEVIDVMVRGDTLLADTEAGLFQSFDDGSTWLRVDEGPPGVVLHEVLSSPFGRFARTDDGVYHSADGTTWQKVGDTYFSVSTEERLRDLAVSPDGTVYAVTVAGCCLGFGGSLYRWVGADEDEPWERLPDVQLGGRITVLTFDDEGRMYLGTVAQDIYGNPDLQISSDAEGWHRTGVGDVYDVAVGPDGTLYAATPRGIRRSLDGGATWEEDGLEFLAVRVLTIGDDGTMLAGTGRHCEPAIDYPYCYSGLGVFRREHPEAEWIAADAISSATPVAGLAPTSTGTMLAVTPGGLWLTADGRTWTKQDGAGRTEPFPYFFGYIQYDGLYVTPWSDILVATSTGAGVYRFAPGHSGSRFDGEWEVLDVFSTDDLLAIGDSTLFAATYRGLQKSSDRGKTWKEVASVDYVSTLARDSAGRLYAGGERQVYRSEDDGETWTSFPVGASDRNVTALAIAPDGTMYAAQQPFIYRSYDEGTTWEQAGPDTLFTREILVNSLGTLFINDEGTVRLSTDGGATWQDTMGGLPEEDVITLALDKDDFLFAGTASAGIYRSRWPARVGREAGNKLPARFVLGTNYPNPVRSTTTIPFTLRQVASVQLTIYDVLGREVLLLVDDTRPAGTYEVVLDASSLSSGTYFYRLDVGGYVRTRTLTVVKGR